jgi:hypothetical protein
MRINDMSSPNGRKTLKETRETSHSAGRSLEVQS